ncbi:hypothetical protein FWG86_02530 [Candidatus Saccharibacteria bacterium]|nr:hypothetical protein [Candidatus Saccharibacteria bacterium]
MAKVKRPASKAKQIDVLKQKFSSARFNAFHLIIALAALFFIICGITMITSRGRALSRLSQQVDQLEQQSTTHVNLAQDLTERLDHIESQLGGNSQISSHESERIAEYYDRLDRKTNTLITVVLTIAILIFAAIAAAGTFLVLGMLKSINQKLTNVN